MKKGTLCKRATAYFLAFTMMASLLPGAALGAGRAGTVQVPTVDMGGVALLNSQSMSSPQFFKEHVCTDPSAPSSFNMICFFKRTKGKLSSQQYTEDIKGAGGVGSDLSYSTAYTRKENGLPWQALYETTYAALGGRVNGLAAAGQLQYNLSAELKRDYHSNFPNHLDKQSDEARVELYDSYGMVYGRKLLGFEGKESDPNRTYVRYGDESTKNWNTLTIPETQALGNHLSLKFGSNQSCSCGSSGVQGLTFALADTQSPTVTEITLSDGNGNPKTYFKAGDSGRVTLSFSEDIRLAGATVPELGAVKLQMRLFSREDNKEVENQTFDADLVELTRDSMIFTFTVPEKIGSAVTNHTVSGIAVTSPSGTAYNQSWVRKYGDRSFPLTIYDGANQPVTLGAQSAKQVDLTHTSSLITDLAGNPLNWEGSTKTMTNFVIDAKAPTVTAVELSSARMSQDNELDRWPEDIDRSAVFVGTGDEFRASALLSEVLDFHGKMGDIEATFNLGGGTVTAKAVNSYDESVSTIQKATRLVFAVAHPAAPPEGKAEPIRITKITFPDGVTDLSGNKIAPVVTNLNNPKQQLWVDTVAPQITLGSGLEPGGADQPVTPLYYEGDADKRSFYVPVSIRELGNYDNPAYTSNINGLPMDFSLNVGPYHAGASMSPSKPNEYRWNALPLAGNDTTVYLHFQLLEGAVYDFTELELSVRVRDYAYNQGSKTWKLNVKADTTGPVISIQGLGKEFNSEARTGTVTITAGITDKSSNLAKVEYQWTDQGAGPVENGWLDAAIQENASQTYELTQSKDGFGDGQNNAGRFHVRATDTEGNVSTAYRDFSYDLTKPAYSFQLQFDPEELAGNITGMSSYQNADTAQKIVVNSPPQYTGNENLPKDSATTLFLIEDKLTAAPDDYFVRTFTTKYNSPEKGQVYTVNGEERYTRWYHVTYEQKGDQYIFDGQPVPAATLLEADLPVTELTTAEPETTEPDATEPDATEPTAIEPDATEPTATEPTTTEPAPAEAPVMAPMEAAHTATAVAGNPELETRLDQLWRKYYGQQDAILLTTYGDLSVPHSFESNYVSQETLTFKNASYPDNPMQSDKAPHSITFQDPLGADRKPIDLTIGTREYDPKDPESLPAFAGSPVGVQIPFTIENRYVPDWGVDDVDFEHSYLTLTYHGLKKGALDGEGEYNLQFKLIPGQAQQTFVFPAELDGKEYRTGYYTIQVHLEVVGATKLLNNLRAEGMATEATYEQDIFFYLEQPDSFGMDDYNLAISYQGLNVHTFARSTGATVPEGYYFTEVKLGSYEEANVSKEQLLNFAVGGLPTYNSGLISKPDYWDQLTQVKWQVWNAADPQGEARAQFADLGQRNQVAVRLVEGFTDGAYDPLELPSDTYPAVPVLKNQEENTLCYRFALQNGYVSPIRQITAYVRGGAPELEVAVSPEKPADGSLVNRVELMFDRAYSPNGAIAEYTLFEKSHEGIRQSGSAADPFTYEITASNTYYAVICDEFGNATAVTKNVDYVDGEAPDVYATKNLSTTPGEFHYIVSIDDDRPITQGRLYITQYSGDFAIQGEVPIRYDGTAWEAAGPQSSGVYYSKLVTPSTKNEESGRYAMELEIKGVHPYVAGAGEKVKLKFTVQGSMSDDMGNLGTPSAINTSEEVQNQKPECTEVTYHPDGGLIFTFNTLVRQGGAGGYSRTLTGLPIYSDGEHTITFQDLFGNEYTPTVTVNAFGELGLEVIPSETQPTREDVTLTLLTKGNGVIKAITAGLEINQNYTLAADGKSASVTVQENDVLKVEVSLGSETKIFPIAISNIDKVKPQAEVRWTYAAPVVGGQTTGDVTATLYCDEPIEGLNGEELSYTFVLGGPTRYTFQYQDQAGNVGDALTVTCPATIIQDPNEVNPEVAPDYGVELQRKRGGLYSTCLRYDSTEPGDTWTAGVTAAVETPAQGYRLSFESRTRGVKLFVTEAETAEAPEYATEDVVIGDLPGVTASGLTVTVDQNTAFRVWLVDRWNNAASLDVALSGIDTSQPTAKVEYVYQAGGKAVRAYVKPERSDIRVTNQTGVTREEQEGAYKDLCYHEFTDNGSFVFFLENEVGTKGSVTAKVITIDKAAPVLQETIWSGVKDGPTNRPITAQFILSKNIQSVKMTPIPEEGSVTVQISGNRVTLTYLKNTGELTLAFTALNGMSVEKALDPVTNIDTTPPEANNIKVTPADDLRSATISFATNEDVLCAQIPVYNDQNQPILAQSFSTLVRENGTYSFHLVDAAGNANTVPAAVTGLDLDTLALRYSRTNGAEDEGVEYAFRLGQLEVGDPVYVQPSKEAKVVYSVDGEAKKTIEAAPADAWAGPFAIAEGGTSHAITATDSRGEAATAFLSVLPPDTTPPVILLLRPTVPVAQGTDSEVLEAAIRENLTVTDDRTQAGDITVNLNTDGIDLTTPGVYTVTATAKDQAQNESLPTSVAVRVYGPDDIYAQVGDQLVFPSGTAVVKAGALNVQLFNLPVTQGEAEPYTIRYKAGYKTAGQMKIGATLVANGTLELAPGMYYTVYVRTQSRKELLFYVLAE